ncbi:MAG: dephospho-CoA kinase, partial [Planctomycetaceae bacterium]
GLVGGIGSGKSAVARWLADRCNLTLIDGDEIGHAALNLPGVKSQLSTRFGQAVFDETGEIDRSALARQVFGTTPVQKQARHDLESIVHPHIRSTISETIRRARTSNGVTGVLLDAAVLLEAGWQDVCDCVVFVDASDAVRRQRVAEGRGWNGEDLARRESSQLPLDEKRRRADFIIANNSTVESAGRQLEKILNRIRTSSV